jgi:hypothetical protein
MNVVHNYKHAEWAAHVPGVVYVAHVYLLCDCQSSSSDASFPQELRQFCLCDYTFKCSHCKFSCSVYSHVCACFSRKLSQSWIMRSPSSVCVCVCVCVCVWWGGGSLLAFKWLNQSLWNLLTVYFISPSHMSVFLYLYPSYLCKATARLNISLHLALGIISVDMFPPHRIHSTIEELLGA